MKKIFILLTLSVMFLSCQNITAPLQDVHNNMQLGYGPVYHNSDFENLDTPKKIDAYLDDHLIYDKGDSLPTGSVEEILGSGKTNCRGYAKVFVNIMYVSTGDKYGFAVVDQSNERKIEDGGRIDHVIVKNGSNLIEPQSGKEVFYSTVGFTYTFDDVFYEF